MNKRGQFFSLYMVMITLAMSGFVMLIYFDTQEDVGASVVSPIEVLELRDDLSLFEVWEQDLILESLEDVSGSWGDDEFAADFRKDFLDGMSVEMKSFLVDGSSSDKVFGAIYSDAYFDGDDLVFVRGVVEKKGSLEADDNEKIRFNVDYVFSFSRIYLVEKSGSGFVLRD